MQYVHCVEARFPNPVCLGSLGPGLEHQFWGAHGNTFHANIHAIMTQADTIVFGVMVVGPKTPKVELFVGYSFTIVY